MTVLVASSGFERDRGFMKDHYEKYDVNLNVNNTKLTMTMLHQSCCARFLAMTASYSYATNRGGTLGWENVMLNCSSYNVSVCLLLRLIRKFSTRLKLLIISWFSRCEPIPLLCRYLLVQPLLPVL